jgi:hypothetical protein
LNVRLNDLSVSLKLPLKVQQLLLNLLVQRNAVNVLMGGNGAKARGKAIVVIKSRRSHLSIRRSSVVLVP